MDKKQILLFKQLTKVKREAEKLLKMEGFYEIDSPTPNGIRKFGDKLEELIIKLRNNKL